MKNNQKGFAIPIIIAIVALLALGGGYAYYKSNENGVVTTPESPMPDITSNVPTTTPGNLIGGDKDEHGCLGPAGYTWCEVKNKCLRVWEEKCEFENKNTFSNSYYNLELTLPSGYFVASNSYGVIDATKVATFFIRKESDDYSGVPVLNVSTNLISHGQTLSQLAQSIYDMNKSKNYVTTDLMNGNYGGIIAYEFGLQSGYVNSTEYLLLDSPGGKVIFLYQNGKVFQFLQTGADFGLTDVINSLKFK